MIRAAAARSRVMALSSQQQQSVLVMVARYAPGSSSSSFFRHMQPMGRLNASRQCYSSLRSIARPSPLVVFEGSSSMSCNRHQHRTAKPSSLSSPSFFSRRNLSSSSSSSSSGTVSVSSSQQQPQEASVDETLDKLFQDSQQQLAEASATGDAWFASTEATAQAAGAAASVFEPVWYNLADQAIVAVNAFHSLTGLEYGWSIVGVTVILRAALFPVMVRTQRATSRMAHLQPELNHMKARYEALGTPSRQDQMNFSKNIQQLFAKYQVKPMQAFLGPLVQLPLFMGMFFGLKKMPHLFPEQLSTGGMFWFPDLTVTDPLYILPLASAGSFLLLIELGKEQMMASNAAQGAIMVNVMRGLSLIMLPVCVNFEASMLCYWTANNVLTVGQTLTLKSNTVRQYFGIWDPPKPVPGMPQPETLQETATKLLEQLQGSKRQSEKEKVQRHNQAVEAKKQANQVLRNSTSSSGASNNHNNNHNKRRRTTRMGITGTQNR